MERWYALQMDPHKEREVIQAMHEAAVEVPTEVNIFNPHYNTSKPKATLPMKSGIRSGNKVSSHQLYEGYMFFYLDEVDIKDFAAILQEKAGKAVQKIFKSPIPDEEIDRAYDLVIQMKKKKVEHLPTTSTSILIGDYCTIVSGAFANTEGDVEDINRGRGTAKMRIRVFGRFTSIEVPLEVLKVN